MTRTDGATRVRAAFSSAADANRAAFVAYVMAGFPTEADAVEAGSAALRCGADILEIGVPFSDPMADGPVIAEAGRVALAAGSGFDSAVRMLDALRSRGHKQPLLAMTYLNPLLAIGDGVGLQRLAEAGADGLIVPDLPAGEMPRFERAAASHGLALSFLVAPNTAPARLEAAIRASTGFLYVVPLYGVTGARESLAAGAVELLARINAAAGGRLPVAAGFGLSAPEHVHELAGVADGVIVGSALIAAMRDGGAEALAVLVSRLSIGVRRSAT
ncbi:MAG: tryptophan synthase subunit alpha [Chloroflexota bacterium]|nr:tryptophan synthase subunit alpha [Chloroflexota bacterium]